MNGPGKTLSIILASCNQLNSLKFTLLSLRDQMPDVPTEIIVVDNASKDGTAQFLVGQGENGTLRVLMNAANIGRTKARNEGAKVSKGRFLLFLDPGLIPGPGWWRSLVSTLQMDPQVGSVAGKIIIADGRLDHAGIAVLEWGGAEGGRLTGRSVNAARMAGAGVAEKSLHVQGLAGEAMMVRATAFFAVGGFNTSLGMDHRVDKVLGGAEPAGLDLSLRLKERGWHCVFRTESIMTRLRLSESSTGGVENSPINSDTENLTDYWLGRIRPDFIVVPGKGATPVSNGLIRPYVEPVLKMWDTKNGGIVNPGLKKRATASVVVVSSNTHSQTKRCIKALLANTGQHHELILVDNASSDGTPEYLLDIAAEHRHVTLILNDRDLGFAAGHNAALAATEADHIVLLGSGIVVTENWLEIMLDAAEQNPRAGLLGPMTNTGAGIQNLPLVDYEEESLKGLDRYASIMAQDHKDEVEKTTRLAGFCLMVKRELLARIGGLDERFGAGKIGDNDYCLRTMVTGYEMLCVRSCFVHHTSNEFSILNLEEKMIGEWETFKAKWGIPVEVSITDPVDMRKILGGGFDVARHFCALRGMDEQDEFVSGKWTPAGGALGKEVIQGTVL